MDFRLLRGFRPGLAGLRAAAILLSAALGGCSLDESVVSTDPTSPSQAQARDKAQAQVEAPAPTAPKSVLTFGLPDINVLPRFGAPDFGALPNAGRRELEAQVATLTAQAEEVRGAAFRVLGRLDAALERVAERGAATLERGAVLAADAAEALDRRLAETRAEPEIVTVPARLASVSAPRVAAAPDAPVVSAPSDPAMTGLDTRSDGLARVATSAPARPAAARERSAVIYFDFASAEISPGAGAALLAQIRSMGGDGRSVSLVVNGHADSAGAAEVNLWLSEARARAVKDYLAPRIAAGAAFEIVAHGEASPAAPTADGAREAKNRRVEVVLR